MNVCHTCPQTRGFSCNIHNILYTQHSPTQNREDQKEDHKTTTPVHCVPSGLPLSHPAGPPSTERHRQRAVCRPRPAASQGTSSGPLPRHALRRRTRVRWLVMSALHWPVRQHALWRRTLVMNTGGTPGGMPVLNRRPHSVCICLCLYSGWSWWWWCPERLALLIWILCGHLFFCGTFYWLFSMFRWLTLL